MTDTNNHSRVLILATVTFLTASTIDALAGDVIDSSSNEHVFVRNGRPPNALIVGPSTRRGNALILQGAGAILHGGEFLYGGDFAIHARIVLPKIHGSGASLIVGGHYHHANATLDALAMRFWLDPKDGKLRVTAPANSQYLIKSEDRAVGKVKNYLTAGKPFDLTLRCEGKSLEVFIDDRRVYQAAAYKDLSRFWLGKVGFMPGDGEIGVIDFQARGRFARMELPHIDLWNPGDDGYFNVRHPVIHTTSRGTIVVIAGGRQHVGGDPTPDQDLIMKRSTDGGRTWSETHVLWDPWNPGDGEPRIEAQMCSAVVDRTNDRILAVSTRQRYDGPNRKWRGGPWVLESSDDGVSWTKPRPMSERIMRNWQILKSCASGIQLARGEHAGRLLIPCYGVLTTGEEAGCLLISDDYGKSWRQSGITGRGLRIPEPSPVELASGKVMVNMRFKPRTTRNRTFAVSEDGGESFGELQTFPSMPGPGCQGAFTEQCGKLSGDRRILFSNPSYTGGRYRMTVQASEDDGKTWPVSQLIYGGFSSYSDMTPLPDGRIGLVFERDSFTRITFVPIEPEWRNGN